MSLDPDRAAALREVLARLEQHALENEDRRALRELADLVQAVSAGDLVPSANVSREKAAYVSHVSHELRVPMTSIKGYTDILLKGMVGELNQQQRDFLTVIAQNTDRMSALIADLRDISRLETGRTELDLGEIAPGYCIRTAVSNTQALLDTHANSLDIDLQEPLPPVRADSRRVIQVLVILLKNAAMYSPPGSAIIISANTEGSFVRIDIQDKGFGIRAEDQPRIFEQFFRSDDSQVHEHPGWGLGLHLGMRLVSAMGGAVGFKSETGLGSTFWFTLPAA